MKYIVKKGNSLHYQRAFPIHLQNTTGKAFYKRLQLNIDANEALIQSVWLACQEEYSLLCQVAEKTNTEFAVTSKKQGQLNSNITLSQMWQEYLTHKNFDDKTQQIANNDWARFFRHSGNLECTNDKLSAQLINNALINHAKKRLSSVKSSTIKRELSLIVAAINYNANLHGMFWRASSPQLPSTISKQKSGLPPKALRELFLHAGDDTSCTDVDTVLLLALLNISPSQISRLRPKDIAFNDTLLISLRDTKGKISRKLPLPYKQQFIRYSIDGAINLCQMSKGYVSRICAERLRLITKFKDTSLTSLQTTFKLELDKNNVNDELKTYLIKGGKKPNQDINQVLLKLFEQYL